MMIFTLMQDAASFAEILKYWPGGALFAGIAGLSFFFYSKIVRPEIDRRDSFRRDEITIYQTVASKHAEAAIALKSMSETLAVATAELRESAKLVDSHRQFHLQSIDRLEAIATRFQTLEATMIARLSELDRKGST